MRDTLKKCIEEKILIIDTKRVENLIGTERELEVVKIAEAKKKEEERKQKEEEEKKIAEAKKKNEGEFLVKRRGSIYNLENNLLVDLRKGDRVCLCSWSTNAQYHHVCSLNNELYGKVYSNVVGGKTSNICSPNYVLLPPEVEKEAIRIAKGKEEEKLYEVRVTQRCANDLETLVRSLREDEVFIFGDGKFYVKVEENLGWNIFYNKQCVRFITSMRGEPLKDFYDEVNQLRKDKKLTIEPFSKPEF